MQAMSKARKRHTEPHVPAKVAQRQLLFPLGKAQAWQLTAANTITRLDDVTVSAGTVSTFVPSQSVTLFVIPSGAHSGNQPPVAKLTATPTSGDSPLTVAFSGTGSTDPDGTLVTYTWDFGDGQKATGVTVSHTYTQGGTFTATLT